MADSSSAEPPHGLMTGRSVVMVAAVFVGHSLLTVPVPGVNEPHYLCKARAFVDSEWCRSDFFLHSANAHAVFFATVGPLTKWLSLEAVAIIGRIVSLTLLAAGWVLLCRRLSLTVSGTVVAAITFCGIALTGNFSGEWLVGGFESKVPSYGFSLLCIAVWMDAWRLLCWRRYAVSGIMAGLAVALHPVVGGWLCVSIAFTELLLFVLSPMLIPPADRRSIAELLKDGLVFAGVSMIVSLPGLIPALQLVLLSDASAKVKNDANLIQVFWRLAHHLDPSTFPATAWMHTAVLLLLTVASLLILKSLRQSSGETDRSRSPDSCWILVTGLLKVSLLIAAVGVLIGWRDVAVNELPNRNFVASILRFYPFRLFDALLPMTTAMAAAAVWQKVLHGKPSVRIVFAVLFAGVVFAGGLSRRPQAPSAYNAESFNEWKQACHWLRENTAADSLVYGPREGFALKWYSDRAEYVCFKDCPQDAPGITEWNRRLWVIHKWAESSYGDEHFEDDDLRELHRQTGITHILTNRLGPFESSPIYTNKRWQIYQVPVPVQTDDGSR